MNEFNHCAITKDAILLTRTFLVYTMIKKQNPTGLQTNLMIRNWIHSKNSEEYNDCPQLSFHPRWTEDKIMNKL